GQPGLLVGPGGLPGSRYLGAILTQKLVRLLELPAEAQSTDCQEELRVLPLLRYLGSPINQAWGRWRRQRIGLKAGKCRSLHQRMNVGDQLRKVAGADCPRRSRLMACDQTGPIGWRLPGFRANLRLETPDRGYCFVPSQAGINRLHRHGLIG